MRTAKANEIKGFGKFKTKDHIHTWNDYNKENKLCCSTCGITYNKYLNKGDD